MCCYMNNLTSAVYDLRVSDTNVRLKGTCDVNVLNPPSPVSIALFFCLNSCASSVSTDQQGHVNKLYLRMSENPFHLLE